MFTRCPECGHTQSIKVEQLREQHGMIHCTNCSTLFDSLKTLSESPRLEAPTETTTELPWTHQGHQTAGHWSWILALGLTSLIGQIVYFEGPAAVQNESVRPWLEKVCTYLKCSLPSYRHLDEFSVMYSDLTPTGDNYYRFQAVINNQAAFPQKPPALKLTLINLSGKPFAQRIFQPQTYLRTPLSAIDPDQPLDISLNLAPPHTTIGGYTFELI